MLGPILRGERISLEPPRREDLDIYRGWFADLEITRYLMYAVPPSDKQEEEWFERAATDEHQVVWRIVASGAAIGTTAIFSVDWVNRRGTTGLLIGDRSQWGKGFASEAVRLRTAYAFEELGLESLESNSLVENVAMHRALERSGYQKVGRLRRFKLTGGWWHDAFIFEVLREEWMEREK